jgi:hypothetical protein
MSKSKRDLLLKLLIYLILIINQSFKVLYHPYLECKNYAKNKFPYVLNVMKGRFKSYDN